MTINYKTIVKMTGMLLVIIGLFMMPSLVVAVIYGERNSAAAFAETIGICFIIGMFCNLVMKKQDINPKQRDAYVIVTACWIIASASGALPFYIAGEIPSYVDAFFESCSGFSTTGSSILTDIEAMSKSMLFWRAFTHWLGGMGIIIFTAAVLPSLGISGQVIAKAEAPGPTLDKITAKFSDTAKKLYKLYFAFTIAQTVLLMFGGLSFYDAVTHAFSTVGTGGFSSYNDSAGHFNSLYVHWVIIIFMFLCGVNFNLYFLIFKGKIKAFFSDAELRTYMLIIGLISAVVFLDLMITGEYSDSIRCITDDVFQVVSVITTTGFATADYDTWPTFCKMMIFILMLTGACSSSTGGGVKVIRILVCLKLIRRGAAMRLHPSRFAPVKIGGRELKQDVATNILNFVFFYLCILFVGSCIIALNGFDLATTVSAVITCMGNIGPGYNVVGPSMNFSVFSPLSKGVLAFLMLAGRLELYAFFMLLSPYYRNANRS